MLSLCLNLSLILIRILIPILLLNFLFPCKYLMSNGFVIPAGSALGARYDLFYCPCAAILISELEPAIPVQDTLEHVPVRS